MYLELKNKNLEREIIIPIDFQLKSNKPLFLLSILCEFQFLQFHLFLIQ